MSDDSDVEAMLEAPFMKEGAEGVDNRRSGSGEDREERNSSSRKKKKSKHHRRSRRSKSRSRSRSRSKSPRRRKSRYSRSKSRSRSRSKSPRRRKSRDHQRKSNERRRRSRSRSYSRERERRDYYGGRGGGGRRDGGRGGGRRDRGRSRTPPPPRDRGERSPEGDRRPKTPPMYKRVGGHSPDVEPPSEERDKRTVMCMQLSARVGPSELEEFFQQVGQVKEVKMIADKNSRRSKGIAYVEFHDEKSIPGALALTGQKLFGIPIIVQMTMAEKNRLAAQAQNLMKKEGPKKLYIGSLHYNITENIIKSIFEPFGHIEKLQIMRDEAGLSKGFGFIEFREADSAERAMANLNGLELAGRPMKINHVTPEGGAGGVMMVPGAMEALDSEDFEGGGIGMTQQGRTQLMAKLAEGHNAGLSVPQVDVPAISACFMLSNMFDPSNETERNWDFDIRDDVLDECNKFGDVLHIHVDKVSPQGNVYVKCTTSRIAAAAFNSLNGRFFAGKKIVAQFIPETTYHLKFPQSVACVRPLKPST